MNNLAISLQASSLHSYMHSLNISLVIFAVLTKFVSSDISVQLTY